MSRRPGTPEYDQILRQVKNWPLEWRVSLVQDILLTVVPSREGASARPREVTWRRARGLLRTAGPAPSDEDVRRWLEEHRLEKYG